jgi:hypothetical protein
VLVSGKLYTAPSERSYHQQHGERGGRFAAANVAALNLFLSQNPRGCARPPRVAQVPQRARLAYLHSSFGRKDFAR